MKTKDIRDIILKELPALLEQDREVREFLEQLFKDRFADREKTEDRFDKILKELAADREIQTKKWEEQERKWQENQKVIHEILESIKMLNRKHENTIGALGARWGLRSEQSLFDSNFSDGG
ncbi:MAG: DUF3782 domain-containing protein [Candidatus Brocadiaceae bacterium]|nr:DUF3782 domain-containing protein [Candidatus Brocadiaceae bacterium]